MVRGNGELSPEARARIQAAQSEQQTTTQTALNLAGQSEQISEKQESTDFAEFISGPGLESGEHAEEVPEELQGLEAFLEAEFGRHLALGYIDKAKADEEELLDLARSLVVENEFSNIHGPGSACPTEDREIMNGGMRHPGTLTPQRRRRIHSAFEERAAARRLSIGAKAFRGMTEIIAETRSKALDEDSSGGWLSKLGGVFK